MPHSFGLATAGSANGQSGPAGGGPDPTAVYTNGLAQAYPARELTSKQIAHGKQIPKNSNKKKKKKTPTRSTRTAHLISFSPFHWLIIFIHSFLSFLIYSNFLARFPHSFPQLPVFCCQKNGPGGVSPEHFWFRWNPTTTNSPYRATHQVAFPCLADRWHLTSQTFFCELKDQIQREIMR